MDGSANDGMPLEEMNVTSQSTARTALRRVLAIGTAVALGATRAVRSATTPHPTAAP